MGFDFDTFINQPCIGDTNSNGKVRTGLFGDVMRYMPANERIKPFLIAGDFKRCYQEVQSSLIDETAITSEQLTIILREADMPRHYRKPLQGDCIDMDGFVFEVIDVQAYVPCSFKLIVHEAV